MTTVGCLAYRITSRGIWPFRSLRRGIALGRLVAGAALSLSLAACGGGAGHGTPALSSLAIHTYRVSGTLTGLSAGTSVVLQVNGRRIQATKNGGFFVSNSIPRGTTYHVSVVTQPTGETCVVSNGTGVIDKRNAINVTVACTANPQVTYTVGGTVSGLSGTLQLLDNGNDAVAIPSDGAFTFPQALFDKASYSVTLGSPEPAGQTCTIASGAGTIAGANVSNVTVTCVTNTPPPPAATYTLGGTVSGLSGTVVLSTGAQSLSISANGTYTFPTPLASGASYAVTVTTKPVGQTCSVTNGTGMIGNANVANVAVTCATNTYSIGGTLSGLIAGPGLSVVLQNNGSDNLTLTGDGAFTFASQVATAAAYNVTVQAQPAHQTCSVSNGAGTVANSDVTGIGVACVANPQFVYVANGGDNTVSAFSINTSTGALTPVPGSPFVAGASPSSIAVNASGTFAYVTNSSDNTVSAYAIDASTGALTPVPGSPFATGSIPNAVTVNPAGTYVYVANLNDSTLSAYSIGANGALTPVPGSPFATASYPSSIAINPAGTLAYVADDSNSTVSAYSIGANGVLTQIAGSPFSAGTTPSISVAINPAGTVVYLANNGDNNVSADSIGPSGSLTPVAGSSFTAGSQPTGVTISPSGAFVYVTNGGDNTIWAYDVGAAGALTPMAGSPFAAGVSPNAVTISPTGAFAYVANWGDNTVSAYSINSSTGALTAVPGSPFAAGVNPAAIAVAQP